MKFDVTIIGSRRVSGMRLFKQALAPPHTAVRSRFVRGLFLALGGPERAALLSLPSCPSCPSSPIKYLS
jgi:hypothetical protein